MWEIRKNDEDTKVEVGFPYKRGKPLQKQGPRSFTHHSSQINKVFLSWLEGCFDKSQAKQIAACGATKTDKFREMVPTITRQRNLIGVKKARAAALKVLKKKAQFIPEATPGDSAVDVRSSA